MDLNDLENWPSVLTAPEISKILRISNMTVYRMLESGEIPSFRINRSYRINRDTFIEWMGRVGVWGDENK